MLNVFALCEHTYITLIKIKNHNMRRVPTIPHGPFQALLLLAPKATLS